MRNALTNQGFQSRCAPEPLPPAPLCALCVSVVHILIFWPEGVLSSDVRTFSFHRLWG